MRSDSNLNNLKSSFIVDKSKVERRNIPLNQHNQGLILGLVKWGHLPPFLGLKVEKVEHIITTLFSTSLFSYIKGDPGD